MWNTAVPQQPNLALGWLKENDWIIYFLVVNKPINMRLLIIFFSKLMDKFESQIEKAPKFTNAYQIQMILSFS